MGARTLKKGEMVHMFGTSWTPQALYLRVIELEPSDPWAPTNLAALMEADDKASLADGRILNRSELCLQAIANDAAFAAAYLNLSAFLIDDAEVSLPDGSVMDAA